jgi:protein kinase-like protein/PEGA domain-containing protein
MNPPSARSFSLHTDAAGAAPPDAFGPFRVLHQIGAGTLGPVFRAYDASRERLVAVKLFKLDLPPERGHQLVAEFERLIAAELSHPAIAAPLATGISGVSAYLVQDYVAADSLDLAVREYGPAPAANALRVAAQLAGALDFAAAVHVMHGALHPRDILLSSDDTRLTGLGVAHALERIGVVAPVRRPYTAPERIAGTDWDRRADVFSLAALMHELIWGRRVSGVGAKAAAHLTEVEGADLAALQRVFARALADRPANRYDTALEFAEALRLACPDVTIAPEPEPAPTRRVTREDEPRLPLDPPALGEPPRELRRDVAHDETAEPIVGPALAPPVDSGELRRSEPTREPHEGGRPAQTEAARFTAEDLEIAPRAAEPDIVYQPAPELRDAPAPFELPTAAPPGLLAGSEADPRSALEVTRTAIWPLVLALGVGIAIGFAGGFFAGSRERPSPLTAAAPASSGREFTEAVPSHSELNTRTAALKTPTAEPPTAELRPPAAESRAPDGEPRTATVASSAVADAGRLLVRSRPEGAHVTVDGRDHGVTPATIRDLPRGAHRVRIARDGYASEERRVMITTARPAQSLMVALNRSAAPAAARGAQPAPTPASRYTGALAVDSRPAGAKVFVDGKMVGTTPMAIPSVAAGSHVVRLEHDGYRRWSSSVRVVASEQNRVTASLER